jgi:hypothetical protein
VVVANGSTIHNVPGGNEENHESLRIAGVVTGIRIIIIIIIIIITIG